MKETVDRRTCDICERKQVLRDGEGKIESYTTPDPRYHWFEVGEHDVCPQCAQIIERAYQAGLIYGVLRILEGEA